MLSRVTVPVLYYLLHRGKGEAGEQAQRPARIAPGASEPEPVGVS